MTLLVQRRLLYINRLKSMRLWVLVNKDKFFIDRAMGNGIGGWQIEAKFQTTNYRKR